jgi:hypothetical protein
MCSTMTMTRVPPVVLGPGGSFSDRKWVRPRFVLLYRCGLVGAWRRWTGAGNRLRAEQLARARVLATGDSVAVEDTAPQQGPPGQPLRVEFRPNFASPREPRREVVVSAGPRPAGKAGARP